MRSPLLRCAVLAAALLLCSARLPPAGLSSAKLPQGAVLVQGSGSAAAPTEAAHHHGMSLAT